MKRADALRLARAAGFKGDRKALARLRVEARVSWESLLEAYTVGKQQSKKSNNPQVR